MNLIQIQEHLKDMPTQAIMGYANGQNPMVPPYLALSEMNRRKSMEQRAAQPPQGSVKEKLEQELMQPQGIAQGMPPQGMPVMSGSGAPVQTESGGQLQTEAEPTSQGFAGGGLTNLPMRSERFSYAPGGIVAFADGDLVALPEQAAVDVMSKQLAGKSDIPMPQSREEARQEQIAKDPRMAAYLNKEPGQAITGLMSTLQAQNEAQRQGAQERQSGQGLATLANALMAGAEGTRGRKGAGTGEAFLGIGKTYAAAEAENYKRKQEQMAIERAQTIEMSKLQADVDNMQRAFAEGRVDDAMKYKASVQAREIKIAELAGLRSKDVLTLADTRRRDAQTAIRDTNRDARQAQHYTSVEEQQKRAHQLALKRFEREGEDRPSAEDKQLTKIQANALRDPAYQVAAKKLQDAEIGSDEYYKILDAMRDIALGYYPKDAKGNYKIEPPPKVTRPAAGEKPAATQGFWDKFFNGPKPTPSPVKPTAVPFDQLPK